MSSHSEAMRTAVHGKVQPMRPNVWGRIRAMLTEEAAVSRALGEKPQPNAFVGMLIISAFAAVLLAGLVMFDPAAPQSSPADGTTHVSIGVAGEGDRR